MKTAMASVTVNPMGISQFVYFLTYQQDLMYYFFVVIMKNGLGTREEFPEKL